jgi:hypothetical protein
MNPPVDSCAGLGLPDRRRDVAGARGLAQQRHAPRPAALRGGSWSADSSVARSSLSAHSARSGWPSSWALTRAKRTISVAYSVLDAIHSVSVTRPVLRRNRTCRWAGMASFSLDSMVPSPIRFRCARGAGKCPARRSLCSSTRSPTKACSTPSRTAAVPPGCRSAPRPHQWPGSPHCPFDTRDGFTGQHAGHQ